MTTDEPGAAVEIGGRTFTLGAVYASNRKSFGWRGPSRLQAPRRLLAYDPDFPWLGGRVEAARLEGPPGRRHERRLDMSGREWAAWAREEVAEDRRPDSPAAAATSLPEA